MEGLEGRAEENVMIWWWCDLPTDDGKPHRRQWKTWKEACRCKSSTSITLLEDAARKSQPREDASYQSLTMNSLMITRRRPRIAGFP